MCPSLWFYTAFCGLEWKVSIMNQMAQSKQAEYDEAKVEEPVA